MKQISTITTLRCECDNEVTAVINPYRILSDCCRLTAALSAAQAVGSPPIAPQSFDAALQKGAMPLPRTQYEDIFDSGADQPVPE